MSSLTYKEIFKYPAIKANLSTLNSYIKKVPILTTFPVEDSSCYVGIEVEVERCKSPPYFDCFWVTDEDGSLRNWGKEFISQPLKGDHIEYALRLLFNTLKGVCPSYEFTPRCSIHVHMNARTMNKGQLNSMMLLYIIFEKLLFNFVGQDRDKNIHCVPLYDTNLTNIISGIINLDLPVNSWMKYTAVNLLPLNSKGTVEFRHMHGTDDIEKIMNWINILLKLKLAAYKSNPQNLQNEIFMLNSNSQYREFVYNVFGDMTKLLITDNMNLSVMMEDCVTLAKTVFGSNNFINTLVLNIDSNLGTIYKGQQLLPIRGISSWSFDTEPIQGF